jgi:hypothetical protein
MGDLVCIRRVILRGRHLLFHYTLMGFGGVNMNTTLCPWCDTEIVWDEELGPEETCPHCLNELSEYRKIQIQLDSLEDEQDDQDEQDDLELFDEELELEDDEASAAVMAYEEAIERQLDAQDEQLDCSHCHEPMVLAGRRKVGDDYESMQIAETDKLILPGPFQIKLFVCPACFRTEQLLSDEDRAAWMERLGHRE